jgi:hypothetical protein
MGRFQARHAEAIAALEAAGFPLAEIPDVVGTPQVPGRRPTAWPFGPVSPTELIPLVERAGANGQAELAAVLATVMTAALGGQLVELKMYLWPFVVRQVARLEETIAAKEAGVDPADGPAGD